MNKTLLRLCRFLDKDISVKAVVSKCFFYVQLRLTTPFLKQDCRSLARLRASRVKVKA
jgi:hypothetical protein